LLIHFYLVAVSNNYYYQVGIMLIIAGSSNSARFFSVKVWLFVISIYFLVISEPLKRILRVIKLQFI